MRLHQQFDLNTEILRNLSSIPEKINEFPSIVEKLTKGMIEGGYTVIKSAAYDMGVPQSITVIKEFTGPFATFFSTKIKKDFNSASKALGIEKLFE